MEKIKKMTKREMFEQIKSKYTLSADEVAFIDHEIELLTKKNSADRKPTAQQTANMAIQSAILDVMRENHNRLFTITELIKEVPACADLTNQKVSALVRQLKDAGKVEKVEDKRKSYFKVILD